MIIVSRKILRQVVPAGESLPIDKNERVLAWVDRDGAVTPIKSDDEIEVAMIAHALNNTIMRAYKNGDDFASMENDDYELRSVK